MRWGSAFTGSTHTSSERELAHVQPHHGSIAARATQPCFTWEAWRGGTCAGRAVCRGWGRAAEPVVMEPGLPGSSVLQSAGRDRCCSLASGERSAPSRQRAVRRAGVHSVEPPLYNHCKNALLQPGFCSKQRDAWDPHEACSTHRVTQSRPQDIKANINVRWFNVVLEQIVTAFVNLLGFGFTLLKGSWVPHP